MGKKQSRQNRGARTGGHDHGATAESKQQATKATQPADDTARRISEPPPSHKKTPKFGHN